MPWHIKKTSQSVFVTVLKDIINDYNKWQQIIVQIVMLFYGKT